MSDRYLTAYMAKVNEIASRAAKLGYYVIGHGEIELKDRTYQLESKSDHSVVTTGSLDVIGAFLTDLERQHA